MRIFQLTRSQLEDDINRGFQTTMYALQKQGHLKKSLDVEEYLVTHAILLKEKSWWEKVFKHKDGEPYYFHMVRKIY